MLLACKKNQISKYLLAGLIELAYKLQKKSLAYRIKVLLIALIVWLAAGPFLKPLIINAYVEYQKSSMVKPEVDTKTPLLEPENLHQNATSQDEVNQTTESLEPETNQIKESSVTVLALTSSSKTKVKKTNKVTPKVTEMSTKIPVEPTKKATKAFEPLYHMVDK